MKNRILLVDDDERMLRSLARSFSVDDIWEVHTAPGPDEALERVEKLRPDVLVLDCDLGHEVKDGFWILEQVRKNPVFDMLPVLFLTGARVSVDDRVRGLGLKADDYILKTAEPEEILLRAKAALEKAQRQQRGL